MAKTIEELMDRLEHMKSVRSSSETAWQEISDLMMPFRGDITTKKSEGGRRVTPVFDSTAMQAADQFVNFIKSAVIPSNVDWLKLEASPPLDHDLTVQKILDMTSTRILKSLSDSNFYMQATAYLRDFAVLGNGSMYVQEMDPKLNYDGSTFGGLAFEAVPISRMWWDIGPMQKTSMKIRLFEMPARDAFRFFDGSPGTYAMQQLSLGNTMGIVSYYHFCYENENDIPGGVKSKTDKKFVSQFVCIDLTPEIVREGGYEYAPYIVSRWMVVDGEVYGRGRGHLARPDAKGINELRRQILVAAGRDLAPVLMVENESVINLDLAPNGLMVTRPPVKLNPSYLKSEANYQIADEIAREDREQIRKAFMGDVFEDPETQPRSAEESRQRQSRVLQKMAAPAEVMSYEFLTPLINSVIELMSRGGALPELEALSKEADVEVEAQYQSPVFTAQKASNTFKVQAFLERRLMMFQATQDPVWLDDVDYDAVTAYDAKISDVPSEIFRTADEILKIREARAAQQAMQMQQEMLQQQQMQQQMQQAAQQQQQQTTGGSPELGGEEVMLG